VSILDESRLEQGAAFSLVQEESMVKLKLFGRLAGFVIVWTAVAVPCWSDEAWGYLWELRTRRMHSLSGDSIKVGRLASSNVILTDSRVSRRHAEIRREPDGIVVLDRRSSNGSYLDGKPMPPGKKFALEPGAFLIFAFEKLIYHRDKFELRKAAIQHTLLGSLVQLHVPVLSDRTVKAFGKERLVEAVTHAEVDTEKMAIRMSYPEDAVPEQGGFQPSERAFVGDVSLEEGEVRVSLWGLARGGTLVSRRASLTHLKHGELRVGLAGEDRREARKIFESRWAEGGLGFLLPLLEGVFAISNRENLPVAVKLSESLLEQDVATAFDDARRATALLHSHAPGDETLPLLSARAEAKWVKKTLEVLRGGISDEQKNELAAALGRGRQWLEIAAELDADKKEIRKAEKEVSEAEKRLEGTS
jgi:pSer/pThr/pTyr-binding forkhead associated (FHA) protein